MPSVSPTGVYSQHQAYQTGSSNLQGTIEGPTVTTALRSLDGEIQELFKGLHVLEERMGPILASSAEKDGPQDGIAPSICQVESQILGYCAAVHSMKSRSSTS